MTDAVVSWTTFIIERIVAFDQIRGSASEAYADGAKRETALDHG